MVIRLDCYCLFIGMEIAINCLSTVQECVIVPSHYTIHSLHMCNMIIIIVHEVSFCTAHEYHNLQLASRHK